MLRSEGEPFVFTVNDGPLKDFNVETPTLRKAIGDAGPEEVLERVLNAVMHDSCIRVTHPNEAEFVAAVPESHRKSEKAYHVKAFRGSKDGRQGKHFTNPSVLTDFQVSFSSSRTASSPASKSLCTSSTSTASTRYPTPLYYSALSTWSSRLRCHPVPSRRRSSSR